MAVVWESERGVENCRQANPQPAAESDIVCAWHGSFPPFFLGAKKEAKKPGMIQRKKSRRMREWLRLPAMRLFFLFLESALILTGPGEYNSMRAACQA